jgi:hypothetical protein
MDIELAIKELKNYKASGTDWLLEELFKYGGDIFNKYVYQLILKLGLKKKCQWIGK